MKYCELFGDTACISDRFIQILSFYDVILSFCQNLIHVGLILADESGQNLLFKHTFIFLVFKLLNWRKISRC